MFKLRIFKNILPKTIAEYNSKINGKILVVSHFGRLEMRIGRFQQSGKLVEEIWRVSLKKARKYFRKIPFVDFKSKKALILGLGAGSVLAPLNRFFPGIKIIGVEIDPKVLEVGIEHFGILEYKNLDILVKDGDRFLKEARANGTRFDIVLTDTYLGGDALWISKAREHIKNIVEVTNYSGVALFNCFYSGKHKKGTNEVELILRERFKDVRVIYVVANKVFVCTKPR